jgi:aminoglycoside phosphotransferase family enzyme/predicted kinase
MSNSQAEVIAFLSRPETYGSGIRAVERHETHASIVFLAGDFAYKLKRAVAYPYLDYSTVERRREMCESEIRINRRTAPQLYLAAKPIVRGPNGTLRLGNTAKTAPEVDWVVVMRRIDQRSLLDQMRKEGRLTVAIARKLGQVVAEFHKLAEVTPAYGGAHAIAAVLDENASLLREAEFPDRQKIERLDAAARDTFLRVSHLLDQRRSGGRVRRCHGDMHLDNICFVDEAPVLIDAIEFCETFSCIDVLYDLAFPLMELMRHGLESQANALLNRYLEVNPDYEGLAALPLFLSLRAAIRAHVALARGRVGNIGEKTAAEAIALLDQALTHLQPRKPGLLAIGGVSGSGKSTLAYGLAPWIRPLPGAVVIRSDITRKQLLGVAETARLSAEAYTQEVHGQVFLKMAERAGAALSAGFSVILDGVYGDSAERNRIAALARRAGAPFHGIWLEAPRESLEARVKERRGDASDATLSVVHTQLKTVSPPAGWDRIDATGPSSDVLQAACAHLLHSDLDFGDPNLDITT